MINRTISFLKKIKYIIKFFFNSPVVFFKQFFLDLKKDKLSKSIKIKPHIIWCAGLPKSGTTLIEEILEFYGVSAKKSLLRLYDDSDLDHVHGISEKLFSSFPKNKITYLKTHSHFSEKYINIATQYNSKIIISMRDIRDVMISRYYHIMNDKNSWQHNSIKNLNFNDGFIKSISEVYDNNPNAKSKKPIEYFYNWILGWQNYARDNNNCLILWYEDYVKAPKTYLEKIKNYLNLNFIDTNLIHAKLVKEQKFLKSRGFEKNITDFEIKTFREGKIDNWKKILDNKILEKFYSELPEDIKKIEYKNPLV
tara:strand:- start:816 stop:1742 length:927 start_codon:yes stop_codon:yes gene_type:complete